MKHFDILLVLGHFRAASAYLSIIRHMVPQARIALLIAQVEPAYLRKTVGTHASFIELCQRFGAEVVTQEQKVSTTLMIVQQYPYPAQTAAEICANVTAARRVLMLGFATAGLEKHDSCMPMFAIRKAYVPSERFMRFLLTQRGAEARFADIEIVEVGLPFIRYPVFPDFSADYVIAAPTLFSFHNERGKHQFLESVLKLLAQIPASARVLYKSHNGNMQDYFAPRYRYSLARVLRAIPGGRPALDRLSMSSLPALRRQAQSIRTGALHLAVLERAQPLASVAEFPDVSIEAFLSGTRGGVIGGLSNTIWGTLHAGLPYYNCIDPALREGTSELLPNRSSDALLDTNLKYFGVPFCHGDLTRGAHGERIVSGRERDADLLTAVRADLAAG